MGDAWTSEKIQEIVQGPLSDSSTGIQYHYEFLHRAACRLVKMYHLSYQHTNTHLRTEEKKHFRNFISEDDLSDLTVFVKCVPGTVVNRDTIKRVRGILSSTFCLKLLSRYALMKGKFQHLSDNGRMLVAIHHTMKG